MIHGVTMTRDIVTLTWFETLKDDTTDANIMRVYCP